MTRPVSERIYDTVREAIFCVARFSVDEHGHPLTLTEVAARMKWSEDQLGDRTSGTKQRFDAEWIEKLTLATKNTAIVRTLCRRVGMVAVPIPKPGCTPADVIGGITEISREYSDAMATLMPCLDGATHQERLDAIQQLNELIEKASAMVQHLEPGK